VLPASAPADELAAWRELAAAWARPENPRIVMDDEIEALPQETAWVVGWGNRFGDSVAERLAAQGVERSSEAVRLPSGPIPTTDHSLVLVARGVADAETAVGWVAADPPVSISGLSRKLPHYNRYSYLAFRGTEPENTVKGMWQPISSPLVRILTDGEMPELVLPPRPPLAELPPVFDATALRSTVAELADVALAGRGLGSKGLDRATDLVEERMRAIGLEPASESQYRQSWRWTGGDPERGMTLTNLLGRIPGSNPSLTGSPVVVMAHLDHLGHGWPDVRTGNEGLVHPGADDNASGVAVLLELARTMASEARRPRPVVFAVVTGEEAGRVGSRHLAKALTDGGTPVACVNLDSVGRLGDGKLYVLNADSAREWRHIFMGVGYTTGAPINVVSEPLDSSDQVSCIEVGVPAIQLFTGPHADYHRPSDTVDRIDADGMAVVTEAVHEAVGYLADRTEPLTVTIGSETSGQTAARAGGDRRASLGTMPDFSFEGPGVRVQQVMPGSAAEAVGILAGDVISAIDGEPVENLRSYSAMLASYAPGELINVRVLRDGEAIVLMPTLGAR
jgi:hypothetical protein